MKRSILMILVAMLFSCAHTPPKGAVPGQLSVDSSGSPIKWRSYIDEYIPKGINDYAGYRIVDGTDQAPYQVKIDVVNSERVVSGIDRNGSIRYAISAEVTAQLINVRSGEIDWDWAGYAAKGPKPFHNAQSRVMHSIAKQLGKEMRRAGVLMPSYYKSEANADTVN